MTQITDTETLRWATYDVNRHWILGTGDSPDIARQQAWESPWPPSRYKHLWEPEIVGLAGISPEVLDVIEDFYEFQDWRIEDGVIVLNGEPPPKPGPDALPEHYILVRTSPRPPGDSSGS